MRVIRLILKKLLRESPHPILDAPLSQSSRDIAVAAVYDRMIEGSFLLNDEEYVRGRFREACRERDVVERVAGLETLRRAPVLDIGAGNGSFELAMATAGHMVVGLESFWNETARRCFVASGLPIRRVIGDAAYSPFRSGTFGIVTCHDTFEHLREPVTVGAEVMRVAKEGALIFVTTPPRLRYLLKRDPHYGIRFLLMLPNRWQQRLARRRGFGDLYHTERIYFTAGSIARCFRGSRIHRILSRWKVLRGLLWDELVLKTCSGRGR